MHTQQLTAFLTLTCIFSASTTRTSHTEQPLIQLTHPLPDRSYPVSRGQPPRRADSLPRSPALLYLALS